MDKPPLTDTSPPLRALLVNDASLSGHHGSALVTGQLRRLGENAGLAVTAGWTWDAATEALARAGHAFDLAIVNGEGSLHSDSRSAIRIAKLARDLAQGGAVPAYLVNATVEGNSAGVVDDLGHFRLRFVRDSRSQAELSGAGIHADVVHDLTLTASYLPPAGGKGALLVTDASQQATSERLLALARRWPTAQAITLRARPPWPERGNPRRRIGFALKRQAARLAPLSSWSLRYGHTLSDDELIDLLAHGARGIVCGRYHAVCMALRMGLPFVAIEGNTGKTGALLADIGLEQRRVSLSELETAGGAFPVAPFSDLERERIQDFLATVERAAAEMFRRIADDARRRQGATGDAVA